MRAAIAATLFLALAPEASASICDGTVESALDGRPVDAWIGDLGSQDRRIALSARDALRSHAGIALRSIVVTKGRREPPVHRHQAEELPAVFEDLDGAAPMLLPALACDDWRVRESAVQVLGWLGPGAEPAIPAMIRSLGDPAWGVRMQAAFTLRRIGVPSPVVVRALRERLADPAWIVANAAATALAAWPDHALAPLRDALSDPRAAVRGHAVRAIGFMKGAGTPALPDLLAVLREDEIEPRLEVIEVLDGWDPAVARAAAPILVETLDVRGVRCPAARLLARLGGESAQRALPVLIEQMQRPQELRSGSCSDSAYIDVSALGRPAIEPLMGLLAHPQPWTRRGAVVALGRIEPTQESLEAIGAMLADDEVSDNAGEVLVDFGVAAVPVLTRALDHESGHVRTAAARALGRIGQAAGESVPKLVALLSRESGEVKETVIFALGRVGGPETRAAIPDLRRALDEPRHRVDAAGALARIAGAEAADVAPILAEDLPAQTSGGCPHPTAHEELRAIGEPAIPTILRLLADPTFPDPHFLLSVLDDLGPKALEAARPIFLTWLDRDGWDLEAALRLQRLDGTASPKMVAIFTEALHASNPWFRLEGAEGLTAGDEASRALAEPVLVELADHPYEQVRARAQAALARLRADR